MSLPPARHRVRSTTNSVKTTRPTNSVRKVSPGSEILFSEAGELALKGATSQQVVDPFQEIYQAIEVGGQLSIIQPQLSFAALNNMPNENSMLRQCLDAMVTNIEGHGWRLEYIGPEDQEKSPAAKVEKQAIEQLLKFPNPDMSIDEVRARARRDYETLGNGFIEACRNQDQQVCQINHIPGYTMRMTYRDSTPTVVNVEIPVDEDDPEQAGKTRTVKMTKYFRRFAQRVGLKTVYFKEWGDPRKIDPATGMVDNDLAPDATATEVIHMCNYAPGQPYGEPRWIGQLPSVLGGRQAELTNLDFFRENAVPAVVVLVSGGRLTEGSTDQIEEQLSGVRGRRSMNRVAVLEALGDKDSGSEDGTINPPRVDIKPLMDAKAREGQFMAYKTDTETSIRSSFRLPPIFVGKSEDYSHATAKASYEVAESQVFGPERRFSDEIYNGKILRSFNAKFWRVRSNPPRITDTEDIISALEAFDQLGALTPNTSIEMANEYFDLNLPKITEPWGDLPFQLTKLIAGPAGQLKGMKQYFEEPEPALTPGQVMGPGGKPLTDETGKPVLHASNPKTTPNADGSAEPKEPSDDPSTTVKSAGETIADGFNQLRYAIVAAALAAKAQREEEESPQEVHVTV